MWKIGYRYQRYEGLSGPEASSWVGISLAFALIPSARSLFLLSYIIQRPNKTVNTQPAAPKAAVVMRAVRYFGASFSMKMLELEDLLVSYHQLRKRVDLRNKTHDICHWHSHGCEHDSSVLVGNIVVVPNIQDHRGGRGAPSHHEASKVGHV